MSEATAVVPATAPADPAVVEQPKPRAPRSAVNKEHLQALHLAEQVSLAGQKPPYAPPLAGRDVSAQVVIGLATDVMAARTKVADVGQAATVKRTATAEESRAGKALIAGLHELQTAGKQKYVGGNRLVLRDFYVGKPLNGSRANLEQTSEAILNKAGEETLPGILPARITAIRALRQAWMDANTAQTTATREERNRRQELATLMTSIRSRRLAIQLAADAQWPHTVAANAAIRAEFLLPANRPLKA